MSSDTGERIPFFRYAFHNVYNYTFLGGVAAAAVLNQNWWLLVLGGGLEALWMLFAPDSRLLQHKLFKPMFEHDKKAKALAAWQALVRSLPSSDAERVHMLEAQRDSIMRLASQNKAFSGQLLQTELDKLGKLSQSFTELAVSLFRYEQYLDSVDIRGLDADIRKQEEQAKRLEDGERRTLAQKNLAILLKRKEKLAEIREFTGRARAQMELIENTFRLLSDQIVTMQSPQELDAQLDELIDGVEAVRSASRETEAMLEVAAR